MNEQIQELTREGIKVSFADGGSTTIEIRLSRNGNHCQHIVGREAFNNTARMSIMLQILTKKLKKFEQEQG